MRKRGKLPRAGRNTTGRRSRRAPAPAPAATALPVCSSCGQPLTRLPSYLASSLGSGAGFQCERCFFPGTGRAPVVAGVVSAETTRWWADLAEEPAGKEVFSEEPEEG